MADTSAEFGFLSSTSSDIYDKELDRILQACITGITGIPGSLVRPRWQADAPNMPEPHENWCAFGLGDVEPDAYPYQRHDPAGNFGNGTNVVERDEELPVLHSFYGPQSRANCQAFCDGLAVEQNRDILRASGIVLQSVAGSVNVPVLMAQKWVRRVDVLVTYKRRTQREYKINTVQSAESFLDNENFVTPIFVTNP